MNPTVRPPSEPTIVVCPNCGTKNRGAQWMKGRQPVCGKCKAKLPVPTEEKLRDRPPRVPNGLFGRIRKSLFTKATPSARRARVHYLLEATPIVCTQDRTEFLKLCEEQGIAMLAAPACSYREVVRETLQHFADASGEVSHSAPASTDMRLFCSDCGHEYTSGHLLGLSRASEVLGTLASFPPEPKEPRCPQCSSVSALYFYDDWQPGRIDETDLAALRAFAKHKAQEFFDYHRTDTARCDQCGAGPISRADAHFSPSGHGTGKLMCSACFSKLEEFITLEGLREDHNCVGRSVFRNARAYVGGSYDRRLTKLD